MLRLIGAIIVLLLILGPILVRVGVADQAGFLQGFVDLETRAATDVIDWVRTLIGR